MQRAWSIGCLMVLFAVPSCLSGCASPGGQGHPDYRERAETATDGLLTISVAALSPEESAEVYELPLAGLGIQPVWLEVENRDTEPYWFLPHGIDPNYFPYWEAAEAFNLGDGGVLQTERRELFRQLSLPPVIPPGETSSGFVLTNLDEGFKFVHADFLKADEIRHISVIVGVPGLRVDYRERKTFELELYSEDEIVEFDNEQAFLRALGELPCCASNKSGSKAADPLNLVIVGGEHDAFSALAERGWHPTEITWSGSVLRMVSSALTGDAYLNAPISPMYLFGRTQDLALQKARDNIHQRNHLRLWRAPMRLHGKPVWVGQVSRDIGTRLTIHSPYLTTHKIDPDVDEARAALANDVVYSRHLAAVGLAPGVGVAQPGEPRYNLTRDPYYTDGYRAVLIFDERNVAMDEIHILRPQEDATDGGE